MKKVLSLLCLLLIVGCGFNNYWEVTDDSINFKNENEALNNQTSSNGTEYLKLKISKSNPIKYLTYDEVIDFLKTKLVFYILVDQVVHIVEVLLIQCLNLHRKIK